MIPALLLAARDCRRRAGRRRRRPTSINGSRARCGRSRCRASPSRSSRTTASCWRRDTVSASSASRRRWTRARCSASRRTPRRSRRRRSGCSSRRARSNGTRRSIRYLPAFAMWDPFVTREITVRDLLVHRSGLGLGAGDLLWWPESTYDRKEIARRLRFIPPATSFRTAYAYDNVLYLIAGELIETISGQTWEDFVATRILAKVGMTGSNVRHSAAAAGGNVATPHAPVDGKVRPIRAVRERQHQPCRRHQLVGRGHGEMAARAAVGRQARRRLAAVLRRDRAAADLDRHADSDRRSAAGAAAAEDELPRLRARLRHPRLPRPQGRDAHRRAARLRVARGDDSRTSTSASRC